jgi:hypothetical protein
MKTYNSDKAALCFTVEGQPFVGKLQNKTKRAGTTEKWIAKREETNKIIKRCDQVVIKSKNIAILA